MNKDKQEVRPTPEEAIKELFGETEREGGDGKATKDEFLIALHYADRYMRVLENEAFWKEVDKGEYSVKTRWNKDGHGDNVLSYIEIRDKNGSLLFMQDIEAMQKSTAEFQKLAVPREENE